MSRKSSSLDALKKLSGTKIITAGDYGRAMAQLDKADDRSFALVWAAMVELALKTAIVRSMCDLSEEDKSKIFTWHGPLSTFSSKIVIGYSFKVFGRKARLDLEKIKDIRNAFAHSVAPLSFKRKEVAAICRLLDGPTKWEGINPRTELPRLLYFLACGYLWQGLYVQNPKTLP